jgi:hypothetical protein
MIDVFAQFIVAFQLTMLPLTVVKVNVGWSQGVPLASAGHLRISAMMR